MGRDDPRPDTTDEPGASPPESATSTDLPIALGDLLSLLANDRTRQLLYLLSDRGGTVFFEELEARFDGAAVELRHNQLPRLDDCQIIDYDRETDAITLTPIGDDLRPVLETIKPLDDHEVAICPDRAGR